MTELSLGEEDYGFHINLESLVNGDHANLCYLLTWEDTPQGHSSWCEVQKTGNFSIQHLHYLAIVSFCRRHSVYNFTLSDGVKI